MKSIALAAALALLVPFGVSAQQDNGLSTPVVALTGVLSQNADTLGLDEVQRADLAAWLDTMPDRRRALEQSTVALRAQLRTAIATNAPQEERAALARDIGEAETALVMMRSNCVDHWREVLSEMQFQQLLELAGV